MVRIQRVQNVALWQRYELCRQGGEEYLGADGACVVAGQGLMRCSGCNLWQPSSLACNLLSWKPHVPSALTPSCAGVNERWLWHGAASETISNIVREGFDMRLAKSSCAYGTGRLRLLLGERLACGGQARATAQLGSGLLRLPALRPRVWGIGAAETASVLAECCSPSSPLPPAFFTCTGTYFGERASTAVEYAKDKQDGGRFGQFFGLPASSALAHRNPFCGMPPDNPSHLRIILARVLLGRQCPGGSGLRRAPPGFDSVTGSVSKGYHVVFDNNQAYPAYVVTLSS